MMPWMKARKWHEENCEVGFEEMLGSYLNSGLVHSSGAAFLCAREVLWEDQTMYCGNVQPNTWFVQLASGDMKTFLKVAPRPLPFVAWQRRGHPRYHVWPWAKFKKKMEGK